MIPAQSPTQDSDHPKAQSSYDSPTASQVKQGGALLEPPAQPLANANGYKIWLRITWPLLLHGVFTAFTVVFMLGYADGHDFNISERRPAVWLHDGTTVPWLYVSPLQSDATTMLSVLIAITRLAAAAWTGGLCWRCAFFLMEEIGLTPQSLRFLTSYGLTSLPLYDATQRKSVISWAVLAILALNIPSHLSAPILTGSITWLPGHHDLELLSNLTIPTALYNGEELDREKEIYNDFWRPTTDKLFVRLEAGRRAATLAYSTWGREGTANPRRYIPELALQVNSTLTNVTIPYFAVHSIEWINDPNSLGVGQLDIHSTFCPRLAEANFIYCPIVTGLAFFPSFSWHNQTDPLPLPPKLIADRWLTTLLVGRFTGNPEQPSGCTFLPFNTFNASSTDLSHAVFVDRYNGCYTFAWVNFTAGAAICYNCLVTSEGSVQNTTSLSVTQDFTTEYALRLLMHTSAHLGSFKFQDKEPVWNGIDGFVTRMLTRSYAASWMFLTETLAKSASYNTTYSVTAPSSRALVSLPRVYIWLASQLLVTLSGIFFIYIQSRTDTAIIVDTSLAAFYLDTDAIYERGEVHETPVMRRVDFEGDRLKLRPELV